MKFDAFNLVESFCSKVTFSTMRTAKNRNVLAVHCNIKLDLEVTIRDFVPF
jgi:hypothetical protein